MKKIILGALALVGTAAMFSSCSKMKFTSDNFTVTPTPLEYVAGEVPATISANIPSKMMKKNAIVTCTPVLRWEGGEAVGTSTRMVAMPHSALCSHSRRRWLPATST